MGGGFFDNVFDPYSGAYAYPRVQRRAQQQQAPARAPEVWRREEPLRKETVRTIPVVDGRKVEREGAVDLEPVVTSSRSEDGSARSPEVPLRKETVRTIPVADGKKVEREGAVKLAPDAAAAKKIQAVYRGYSVRKTEPLKHLRLIEDVKEELAGLKRRLEEPEQKKKLWRDAQERLRWTEGVMALLLRLDSLQGVLPEVRVLRKAMTKELLELQEMVDSMSVGEGVEKHVPQVQSDMHDESAPFPESDFEEADPEVPLDVEKEQILTTEEAEVEPAAYEVGRLTEEVALSHASDSSEEKETTSGCRNEEDGQMTPAHALSDRALMLQLVEENRKLKDVVKRVLHWNNHQNDVIHDLAARIKQLEEDHLLGDEKSVDRKDVFLQLANHIDSEDWPSAGSDDSF